MIRSLARRALPFASGAFVACAIVQVFLAGLGVFDDPKSFVTHREFGYAFGWLTLVTLVLALVGRSPRRTVGLAVLLLVAFAFQSVFVAVRESMPEIAAVHPLNGFLILAVGVVLTNTAWAERRVEAPRQDAIAASSAPATDVG